MVRQVFLNLNCVLLCLLTKKKKKNTFTEKKEKIIALDCLNWIKSLCSSQTKTGLSFWTDRKADFISVVSSLVCHWLLLGVNEVVGQLEISSKTGQL